MTTQPGHPSVGLVFMTHSAVDNVNIIAHRCTVYSSSASFCNDH